ncbi:MAG: ester cyclase [Flavobacterium sp.]|jgi:steroid delta-isomerase-like uncharacterized protein|nr:ester cyclase [Flavobacterium sp.]
MKKLLVLLAVSVSLFACKSEADKNEKIAQDNIKFYSNVWDVAINQGNISILDEAYAPDVVLHTVPETKGAANAKAYYANYVTGFSDREFTVKETFAQGNKLTKYWVFKGKHTGDFFGIPATGKTISVEGCTIATIINGKITEERDFFDNLEFLRQLGLMPR